MKAEAEAAQEADDAELKQAAAELKATSEGLCRSVNVNPEDARLVETDGTCASCRGYGGVGDVCVSCWDHGFTHFDATRYPHTQTCTACGRSCATRPGPRRRRPAPRASPRSSSASRASAVVVFITHSIHSDSHIYHRPTHRTQSGSPRWRRRRRRGQGWGRRRRR